MAVATVGGLSLAYEVIGEVVGNFQHERPGIRRFLDDLGDAQLMVGHR